MSTIPQYITHQKPQPKTPVQSKPTEPPPSVETLQRLVDTQCEDIALQLIDRHGLKLKIQSGKILDTLEGTDLWLERFLTEDPATKEMKELARQYAKSQHQVLITGESGTGKELIAKAMIGDRKGKFVAINCAGLPENLIESELFGYVRGAFTGAAGDRQGLMASAKDGVFFLDEVGELPLHVQAKFLRAIQERTIRRVGGMDEEEISCKIVCATHRNLREMHRSGLFREDLYARLSTLELHIPPLRDRNGDVELLIKNEKLGQKFLDALKTEDKRISDIDLTYNVRSIQRILVRFEVTGKVILT